MSKVLKRLYLGDVVKSFGTKQLRKLTTETEEPTESIIGAWVFKEAISWFEGSLGKFPLEFYSAGSGDLYHYINSWCSEIDGIYNITYDIFDYGVQEIRYKSSDGWSTDEDRTIIITEEPTNKTFIEWLKANAIRQDYIKGTWVLNDTLIAGDIKGYPSYGGLQGSFMFYDGTNIVPKSLKKLQLSPNSDTGECTLIVRDSETTPYYCVYYRGDLTSDNSIESKYSLGDGQQTIATTNAVDNPLTKTIVFEKELSMALNNVNVATINKLANWLKANATRVSLGLKYTSNGDGTCEVKIGDCTDTEIFIPSTSPEGESVVTIGAYGYNGKKITSISIPDSVTLIDYNAFMDCDYLTSISMGNGVTQIGSNAFDNCDLITSINLPDSLKIVESEAFDYCKSLSNINIPNSVTDISSNAFRGCTSLIYEEYDNGLYLGNETNPYYALIGLKSNATSITIHNDTKVIMYQAFADIKSLTYVVIGYSVAEIPLYCFRGCTSLNNITFNGTTNEWNSITLALGWNRDVPATYVQCTDGTVTL